MGYMPPNNMEGNDELKKQIITISGMELKTMKNGWLMTKLKDEKGLNYNIFHTKKDGSNSRAYEDYSKLPAGGVGATVEMIYKESEFTNEHGTFTSRGVVMVNNLDEAKTEDAK